MTTPAQNLQVHVDSGEPFDVREFDVHERMSSLFEITLVCVSPNANVDFEAIVGQRAEFRICDDLHKGTPERFWTGICRHIEQIAVEPGGLSTYRLVLVPMLWLATQRRNHRMFQQITEPDIVRKLLGEWYIEPDVRLSGAYKKRKYRVQYAESDYAFMSRMLEDAGISFFFEQGEAETRLVLSDAPQKADARAKKLAFRDNPMKASEEHVTKVHVGHKIRPGRYTMQDVDYRRAPSNQPMASVEQHDVDVEARLERFHYTPGAFLFGSDKGEGTPSADDKGKARTDDREGESLARKRLEAKRASAKVCTYETNVLDLAPGVVMAMLDHPRAELGEDRRWLLVASHQRGTSGGDYAHSCEARSADQAYRPPVVTAKPKISGVESATVVGPAGEEIHTDEFGRVRVHFHWDRESGMDDDSSCWIHVSQPWGGAGYGATNLPRIGQEVLVDFLGGDPDRPVITGRVYTAIQPVPYGLPGNKTQSGWKSNSSPQTGGYNEIMFEDSAGQELVRMQAEKDLKKLVKNDETVTIGHDRKKLVKNDDALTVGQDRTKVVQRDESVTIGNDRKKHVMNDEVITIGNDQKKVVENDEVTTVRNDRTKVVENNENVTIGNDRTKTIQNNESVTIGNDHSRHVKNDESVIIGNDHNRHVKSNEAITIGKDLVHMVMANARDVTALSKNTVVGLSRSTMVGMIDSTIVGKTHVVMVSPPGEQAPGDCTFWCMEPDSHDIGTAAGAKVTMKENTITLDSGPGPTITLTGASAKLSPPQPEKRRIVLDTGLGAKITLDGPNVTIEAGAGGEVIIKGGPIVKINPPAAGAPGNNDALTRMDPGSMPDAENQAASSKKRAEKFQGMAKKLGKEYGVPPALVLGLMSRETHFGELLDANGKGDHGHGFGILQVDDRSATPAGTPYGYEHARQAMDNFKSKLDQVALNHPDWTADEQLAGAVAGYNMGASSTNVATRPTDASTWEALDRGTAHNNYSRDTWARARWFADNLKWTTGAGFLGALNTGHSNGHELTGQDKCPPAAASDGSEDVFINGKAALRVDDSFEPHECDDHSLHSGKVQDGSKTVMLNDNRAAARIFDVVTCGGHLATGSEDVVIGD